MTGVLALALTACSSSDGTALARKACTHVDHSLTLFARAGATPDASAAAALRQQAYIELRTALPIAASAAYDDGSYEALATTLEETNRVPEAYLVPALTSQCAAARTASPNGPGPVRTTIPPPPTDIPPPPNR